MINLNLSIFHETELTDDSPSPECFFVYFWREVTAKYHGFIAWEWTSFLLTHWSRVTHKCVSNVTIIGSDNGLSPVRRQTIIWTNAGILLIAPSETNFSEIFIEIYTFSFKKMRLKGSSAKWRPFCFGLNVLMQRPVWSINSNPAHPHILIHTATVDTCCIC